MSPTEGDPTPEPAVPSDAASENPDFVLEPLAEDLGMTKIEKSITQIVEETPPEQPGDAAVVEVPLGQGRRPGRPPRTTEAPVTWSVRGISRDTRGVFERGASQAGKTLGQYLNEDVRRLVEQQLAESSPPATLQSEIQYLRQLVENLTTMIGAAPPAAGRGDEQPAG